jgi:Transposase
LAGKEPLRAVYAAATWPTPGPGWSASTAGQTASGGRAVPAGGHRAAWEAEILAFHATDGCSNGPTEAVNLLVTKAKRVGHGFPNVTNYRLRPLLHCGVRWQTPRTVRQRGRARRLVAQRWFDVGLVAGQGSGLSEDRPTEASVG